VERSRGGDGAGSPNVYPAGWGRRVAGGRHEGTMYKGVVPCRYRVNTVARPLGDAGEMAYRRWQLAN
jgi:hypothetical protein